MTRHGWTVCMGLVWCFLVAKTAQAATLGEFVGPYDFQLIQWAALTALLGGMIRTILSLESDKRVIRDIAREAVWDAFKSLIAGMAAFALIQALRSYGWQVPSEVRFAAVMAAGWQRIAAIDWMRGAVVSWLDSRKGQALATPSDQTKDAP